MGFHAPASSALGASVDFSELEAAAVITEGEGIASNDNDTSLPTSAAVKDYADTGDAGRQPLDAELTALAGLTSAANKIPRFTGSETADLIDFLDEDTMSSDSASAVPSQQSVKAYVDANAGASAPRRSMGVQLNTTNAGNAGTAPTDSTSLNGVTCDNAGGSGAQSVLKLATESGANWDFYDKSPEFNIDEEYSAGSATGNGVMWFGDTGGNRPPTVTQTNKGMWVMTDTVSGTLTPYACNANGTTNTNTSLSGITFGSGNSWRVVMDSGVDIKYYCNYTLKATHTTNLPSGDNADSSEWFNLGVDNDTGDTTTRTARFGYCDILIDAATS